MYRTRTLYLSSQVLAGRADGRPGGDGAMALVAAPWFAKDLQPTKKVCRQRDPDDSDGDPDDGSPKKCGRLGDNHRSWSGESAHLFTRSSASATSNAAARAAPVEISTKTLVFRFARLRRSPFGGDGRITVPPPPASPDPGACEIRRDPDSRTRFRIEVATRPRQSHHPSRMVLRKPGAGNRRESRRDAHRSRPLGVILLGIAPLFLA